MPGNNSEYSFLYWLQTNRSYPRYGGWPGGAWLSIVDSACVSLFAAADLFEKEVVFVNPVLLAFPLLIDPISMFDLYASVCMKA